MANGICNLQLKTGRMFTAGHGVPLGYFSVSWKEAADPPAADVTLGITNGKGPVLLGGIIVRETRRADILALDLPSLEDWTDEFKYLTPAQVERISSPEFYDFLRIHYQGPSGRSYCSVTARALIVMPRSRSMSISSSI